MLIPIVFIHYGDSEYLRYTLLQSKQSNPENEIILIGDDSNNKYHFVKHLLIKDYSIGADRFATLYKHRSVNEYKFELFSFQRWFILYEFMRKNQHPCAYYQDSDNMLYAKVNQQQKVFNDYQLALFHSGHTAFINSLNALGDFCDFVVNYFSNNYLSTKLDLKYQQKLMIDKYTGITDGTLMRLYLDQCSSPYRDFADSIPVEDSLFDANINLQQGFEMLDGKKKVYLMNKSLFGKQLTSNKWIRFNTLQFQGNAKRYIKYFTQDHLEKNGHDLSFFDYNTCSWTKSKQ